MSLVLKAQVATLDEGTGSEKDADISSEIVLMKRCRFIPNNSYKANNVHNDLYEALQKSLELDYSNQRLANQEEACKKRRKRRDAPRSPPGSPPLQPPPPPPPAGTSSAPGTSGASGSSQLPPPPPHPSSGTSGSTLQQGHKVPSSSKTTASAQQSMAWTTSNTRYESTGITGAQDSSPTESLMHDDSTPDEKASALASSYEPPAENSLLAKTGDMTNFLNWYCHQINKSKLTQADLEGQAYEFVKVFYPDIIHLQFQMEECHKMLTDQGSMPVLSISKMKAARYPDFGLELLVPEQMWIEDVCTYDISAKYGIAHWWFNRQKFCIDRHDSPSHPDFQEHTITKKDFKNLYPSNLEDLNLLLLQGHLDHLSGSDKWMLLTAVKLWTRNLVIRQRIEDFQLGIESYQTQLNLTKLGWDAIGYEFKHDYTIIESPREIIFPVNNIKEFKIKRLNLGINTHFWTEKDVTRSKEFITAIERRLKTRRIYRNLECFVGGRVRDIDYRLLQRTE
ncbi:hypothetical protein Tco_1082201 [Tanacetum coccineum]|uniref:Uncharacterized protein n=1 Tax=Tanacetum coccineum TaxID=301880 RepID=A0ABQ5I0V8_9ASTR